MRAFIAGCLGPDLSEAERRFFAAKQPWGFILFRRNIVSPEQVLALTSDLRACVGRRAPILIDQEGGRVQRMGPPHWPAYPPARRFAAVTDPMLRREAVRLAARLMAHDLKAVGIDVDCAPVLDVPVQGAHDVIGDRAYGFDVNEASILGRAMAEGLLAGGVLPIIKHIPGHGRAGADSHHALPRVDAGRDVLSVTDFMPFRHLADMPAAMTAHVVYEKIDKNNPATVSRKIIHDVIRVEMGFDGLLITDDLSMKALKGSFADKTRASFKAGCDLVLHCHGIMHEMEEVAEASPFLRGKALKRCERALARIAHLPEPLDVVAAHARLQEVLGASARGVSAIDPTVFRADTPSAALALELQSAPALPKLP